jgi:hypothetical protein
MTAYLESMKNATYVGPAPTETPKTVIAALGPRMLEVAAKHADGAHPYNVTPEHAARPAGFSGPIGCCARSKRCYSRRIPPRLAPSGVGLSNCI